MTTVPAQEAGGPRHLGSLGHLEHLAHLQPGAGAGPVGVAARVAAGDGSHATAACAGPSISASDMMAATNLAMGMDMDMDMDMTAMAGIQHCSATPATPMSPQDGIDLDIDLDVDWTGLLDATGDVSGVGVTGLDGVGAAAAVAAMERDNPVVVPHDRLFAEDEMVQPSPVFMGGLIPANNGPRQHTHQPRQDVQRHHQHQRHNDHQHQHQTHHGHAQRHAQRQAHHHDHHHQQQQQQQQQQQHNHHLQQQQQHLRQQQQHQQQQHHHQQQQQQHHQQQQQQQHHHRHQHHHQQQQQQQQQPTAMDTTPDTWPANFQPVANHATSNPNPQTDTTQALDEAQAQARGHMPVSLNLNDPTTLQLYDQVLLWYFNASAQDELVFEPCDSAKEAVLHRLAMRFQLSYGFDAAFRRASIRRASGQAPAVPGAARHASHHTHHSTSSTGPPGNRLATDVGNVDALGISSDGCVAAVGNHTSAPMDPEADGARQTDLETVPAAVSAPTATPTTAPTTASAPVVRSTPTPPSLSTHVPSTNHSHVHHRLSLPSSAYASSPFAATSFPPSPFSHTQFSPSSFTTAPFSPSSFVPAAYPGPDVTSFLPRQTSLDQVSGLGLEPDWSSRSSLALSRTSTSSGLSSFSSPTSSLSPAALASATFVPARPEFSSDSAAQSGEGIEVGVGLGVNTGAVPHGRDRSASRIGDSISQRVSTWKIFSGSGKSLGIHRGRKGPLNAYSRDKMRALEQVGGACWRCKVIRRKCDAGSPCKSCPAPHLGEDAPLWPVIGCRRGSLCDAMPRQSLCPKARRPGSRSTMFNSGGIGMPDRNAPEIAAIYLRDSEAQRRLDANEALNRVPLPSLAKRGNPEAAAVFADIVACARFRDSVSLNRPSRIRDKSLTCADLITNIAWELADNRDLASLLEIESPERFIALLQTACTYEAEVAKSSTSLVIFSVICLRYSLDVLRLYNAHLVGPEAHSSCTSDQCSITSIRVLCSYLAAYVDGLSLVMFKKENLRDRRWWLSTFYSLCIQSHVRHVLILVEKELIFPGTEDPPAESLYSTQYLHLAAVLFTAASAQYDPLIGGRLQYALTDDSVVPETSVPELHHLSARNVFGVDKWSEKGIKTSYAYLRHLLQIGSLDFESDGNDTRMIDASDAPYLDDDPSGTNFASTDGESLADMDSLGPLSAPHSRSSIYSNSSISDASLNSLWTHCTDATSATHLTLPADTFGPDRRRSKTSLYSVNSPSPLSTATTPGPDLEDPMPPITQKAGRCLPRPLLVCKCCPKKPQQFQTAEELMEHEGEKPFPCSTCQSRFKTAAEAERHMNAVHRRPESWSCARLGGPREAFHSLKADADGTTYDICGYCGRGFKRPGSGPEHGGSVALEMEDHVKTAHVFGGCNRDKKFYRADHFRQHLKVSHSAVPGRWNKFLERACKAREFGDETMP